MWWENKSPERLFMREIFFLLFYVHEVNKKRTKEKMIVTKHIRGGKRVGKKQRERGVAAGECYCL